MTLLNGKQVMSVIEAGKVLNLGKSASYNAAKRGEIPTIRIGRRIVVPVAALQKLLETGSIPE